MPKTHARHPVTLPAHASMSERRSFMLRTTLVAGATGLCLSGMLLSATAHAATAEDLSRDAQQALQSLYGTSPAAKPIAFSTTKMPPVMTGAQKKPPRFSQNSRFNNHVNAPGLEDLPNVDVTAFMRRFLS